MRRLTDGEREIERELNQELAEQCAGENDACDDADFRAALEEAARLARLPFDDAPDAMPF